MSRAESIETSLLSRAGEGAGPTGVETQPNANARLPTFDEAQILEPQSPLTIREPNNPFDIQKRQRKYQIKYHSKLLSDSEVIDLQRERMINK